jgi:hypothetical protein
MRDIMADYPAGFCSHNAADHKYKFTINNSDVREFLLLSYENQETKRGYHPDTIVLDECGSIPYSMLGLVIEPMLAPAMSTGTGRLLAIGTAKGKNRFFELIERGKDPNFPDWESYIIPASSCNLLNKEYLERARVSLTDSEYAQEFECDFSASVLVGSIYSPLMNVLQSKDPTFISDDNVWVPELPVNTAWDLGHSNNTSIWFWQVIHGNPVFIDFFEDSGRDITYYANETLGKGYVKGIAYLPPDADHQNIRSPVTIREMLANMGIPNEVLAPTTVSAGIEQSKLLLRISKFNSSKCQKGIEHLKSYRYKVDFGANFISGVPLHDEHSDAADAFRYAAVSKNYWTKYSQISIFHRQDYNIWD